MHRKPYAAFCDSFLIWEHFDLAPLSLAAPALPTRIPTEAAAPSLGKRGDRGVARLTGGGGMQYVLFLLPCGRARAAPVELRDPARRGCGFLGGSTLVTPV
jgi:hypothetical protein